MPDNIYQKYFDDSDNITCIDLDELETRTVTGSDLLDTADVVFESQDGRPHRVVFGSSLIRFMLENAQQFDLNILDVETASPLPESRVPGEATN